jgi:hypothetical protein
VNFTFTVTKYRCDCLLRFLWIFPFHYDKGGHISGRTVYAVQVKSIDLNMEKMPFIRSVQSEFYFQLFPTECFLTLASSSES